MFALPRASRDSLAPDPSGESASTPGSRKATSESGFQAVVIATPPQQAAPLAGAHSPLLAQACAGSIARATWVGMLLVADELVGLPDIIDVVPDSALSMLVREDTKPGRQRANGFSRWVAHGSPSWSKLRLTAAPDEVGRELTRAALSLWSTAARSPIAAHHLLHADVHRWSLARPTAPEQARCIHDSTIGIVLCGDGFNGFGVQEAVRSGEAAAETLTAATT